MITWERHIDATRADAGALYSRLSAPASFVDGAPADYGFGIHRSVELGRPVSGHGGALRGWRSHRLYVPSERISVVVLFNHLSDARSAALDVLAAALGETRPQPAGKLERPDWLGSYIEPETGLSARIDMAADGQLRLRYGTLPERLALQDDGTAKNDTVVLRPTAEGLWMDRRQDHQSTRLQPRAGTSAKDVAGQYRCAELDATLSVVDAGGVLYGGFSGFLGRGRMELLEPVGVDVWALPCPRALDHSPPGDWTLAFRRDGAGHVVRVDVGCWLARRLPYARFA
jgi:D-aminopeptidase